jgi:hypothetical protein
VHRDVSGAERTAEERARVEFDTLRLLREKGRENGHGTPPVPAALDFVRRDAALVLERVAAAPLDERIRRWRRLGPEEFERRLVPSVRAAGEWLRWFQECTSGAGGDRCREVAEGLRERALSDLSRAEKSLARRLKERTRAVLGDLDVSRVADGTSSVGHHCDFWPGNVLEADGQVSVIDFEGFRSGLPYQDLAHFLVHLDLVLHRPGLASSATRARRALLEGYGTNGCPDSEEWTLCLSAEALALMTRDAGENGLLARLRIRCASRWLERAIDGEGALR